MRERMYRHRHHLIINLFHAFDNFKDLFDKSWILTRGPIEKRETNKMKEATKYPPLR